MPLGCTQRSHPGADSTTPIRWQQLPGPEAFLLLAQHSSSFCSHDKAPSARNKLQEHLPPRPGPGPLWFGPLADLMLPAPQTRTHLALTHSGHKSPVLTQEGKSAGVQVAVEATEPDL